MVFKNEDDLFPRAVVNDVIVNDVWENGEGDRYIQENTLVSITVT